MNVRITESELNRRINTVISEAVSRAANDILKENITMSMQISAKENEAIDESFNRLIMEGKFSNWWRWWWRSGDAVGDIGMGVIGTMGLALLAFLGNHGYNVYNRNQVLNQVRSDFVKEYRVDPDTLSKDDPRFKTFGEKELNVLIDKGLVGKEDKWAYRDGRDIRADYNYNTPNRKQNGK